MNYNIPYYSIMPMTNAVTAPLRNASGGLFSRLLGGFNLSSLLTNTQRTLNIVNQTIPIVKQINPLVKNAKTMFKVMNEFKKVDNTANEKTPNSSPINPDSNVNNIDIGVSNNVNTKSVENDGPVFFIK